MTTKQAQAAHGGGITVDLNRSIEYFEQQRVTELGVDTPEIRRLARVLYRATLRRKKAASLAHTARERGGKRGREQRYRHNDIIRRGCKPSPE